MLSGVLAIKWRPNSFSGLVGQEHITKTLSNALSSQRLHHAYLFCGTRGIGKTTVARILAKSLSCDKGIAAAACNECSACKSIDEGNYADLVEVDAASRTKVESTRELLDDMQFAPTKGRYKIYLIDEVHMLSNHSFNALLKSLEEPPPHIIFIFATTEPQKLPVTVLSRCLKFNLKAIDTETIAGKLREILPQENVTFDEESLKLISHYASGSMRDALSLTDQAIAYCDSKLQGKLVADMLGVTGIVEATELLEHIASGDLNKIIAIMHDMEKAGANFTELWDRMMLSIHSVTLASLRPAEDDTQQLTDLATKFSREELQLFYQISLNTKRELPWVPSMRSASEMAFIRMLSMQPLASSIANHQQGLSIASRIPAALPAEAVAAPPAAPELDAPPVVEEQPEVQAQPAVANELQPVQEEQAVATVEATTESVIESVMEEQSAPESVIEHQDSVAQAETHPTQEAEQEEVQQEAEPVQENQPVEETPTEAVAEPVAELADEPVVESATTPIMELEPSAQANQELPVVDPLAATSPESSVEQLAETPLDYASTPVQDSVQEPATATVIESPSPVQETQEESPPAPEITPQDNPEVAAELTQPEPESQPAAEATQPAPESPATAATDYTQAANWAELVEDLDLMGLTDSIMRDTRLAEVHGGIWIVHCISNVKNMFTDEMIASVENAIAEKINQSIQLELEVGPIDDTPAMLVNLRKKEMVERIKQEPAVSNVINKLGGRIVEDSVRPLQSDRN